MIRLQKQVISAELSLKIAQRTARFLELSAAAAEVPENLASAYKVAEVKELLRAETADKCAYCESKVPHVDYGDVEHIIPKSVKPELRYEYSNLTYSCGICNNKKGDYHDAENPLLNPYQDEPDVHLIAMGPMVFRSPTSDRGLVTQKRLDLNRASLVERRAERLEAIATLIDQIARTENDAIKLVLTDQVERECASDKEYAFVVRSFVRATKAQLEQSQTTA